MLLIYLHGLNGSSRSHKAELLRQAFAAERFLAPDYPAHRPDEAVARLFDLLAAVDDAGAPVVIGSSLGGFYARYLATRVSMRHLYLINPALEPWRIVDAYLGDTMTSAGGEHYPVDAALRQALCRYAVPPARSGDDLPVPTTLFLDHSDELLDWRIAAQDYAQGARVCDWPGGSHAFEHLNEALAIMFGELDIA